MSNICIGIVKDVPYGEFDSLRSKINIFMNNVGYGVFFSHIFCEPFFATLKENDLIFSLADNYIYDNCEMLMLRDGNYYNDKLSEQCFAVKMCFIKDLLLMIKNAGYSVELYVGESGELPEEYTEINVKIDDFVCFMENADDMNNYHLIFS